MFIQKLMVITFLAFMFVGCNAREASNEMLLNENIALKDEVASKQREITLLKSELKAVKATIEATETNAAWPFFCDFGIHVCPENIYVWSIKFWVYTIAKVIIFIILLIAIPFGTCKLFLQLYKPEIDKVNEARRLVGSLEEIKGELWLERYKLNDVLRKRFLEEELCMTLLKQNATFTDQNKKLGNVISQALETHQKLLKELDDQFDEEVRQYKADAESRKKRGAAYRIFDFTKD